MKVYPITHEDTYTVFSTENKPILEYKPIVFVTNVMYISVA